jgi:hypothetical protein
VLFVAIGWVDDKSDEDLDGKQLRQCWLRKLSGCVFRPAVAESMRCMQR